jgi:hypothetical protein
MLPTNFPPPVELLDEDELELLLEEDEPLTVTLKACVLCAPQVLV